jgi:carboxypeptidase family protein/TonB-dependent receptor-like protein
VFDEEVDMLKRFSIVGLLFSTGLLLALAGLHAQSFNSSMSGTVTDPSGALVPDATLTLTAVGTGAVSTTKTGSEGLFAFPNLQAGAYELKVSASGFRDFVQRGIQLLVNQVARLDVKLELGAETQTIEVLGDVSPLNFETPTVKQAINPEVIRELPLIVGGAVRSAAAFVTLMPGVSTGAGSNGYDTRINGGLQSGDEAVIDGVTITQGINGNTGMISAFVDYPWSPEAISEVSVQTANYEPQYGSTTSGVITAETKAGTKDWHGTLYEFHRNTVLNARQFGIPRESRPKDIENDYGGNISGPIKIPWFFSTPRKNSYFFVNYEGFKIRGGANTPILSIPSLKERQGDFSDWVDSDGNLIPIFDPATTRPNPNFDSSRDPGPDNLQFLRDQFMGCDGHTPNVICSNRIQNSSANRWLQFLPTPTFPGVRNNYVVPEPIPDTVFADSALIDIRVDQYWRDRDHFFLTVHYRGSTAANVSELPPQLSNNEQYGLNYSFVDRFNWTHTFNPTVLNHFAIGYLNTTSAVTCFNQPYADQLQVAGTPNHDNPPALGFEDFAGFGCNNTSTDARPVWVANDLMTWVKGKHTFKFGGEIRKHGNNSTSTGNGSGTLNFTRVGTGLNEFNSGNAVASFLLEQVADANYDIRTVEAQYPRSSAYNFHFGDTFKVTPKLSLNFGIRWDMFKPTVEKFDHLSFFDLLGTNPAAANRPGRLAFAGDSAGAASFGRRHPEQLWKKGFAPRVGVAYSLTPKTVIRAGYGIFFSAPIYPGWGGGIAQDGFNANIPFVGSNSGYTPAFLLSEGFPAIAPEQRPPFIDPSFRNGQDLTYRPFDGNRLPYSQQWNLTIEHEFTNDFYISTAYVANKGTRLPSRTAALNALDPKYLSMGPQLYDEFQLGDTSLHGVPLPYPGWVEQMQGCAPTVGQALLPYPQYCSSLQGLNENAGNSTYHSFQFKAEKRFSKGFYLLGSYTLSKLLTSSDGVQADAGTWSGALGVISPYERHRNKALALSDVPQSFVMSLVYQLPLGEGKRLANKGGVVDKIVSGWQVSTVFRATSGVPLFFRSGNCNVPGEFRVQCVPAVIPGKDPFAQDKGNYDPNKPLFNPDAFELPDSFNFYFGQGPRVSNLRGFGYHNQDLSLIKNTRISERVNLQFRAELFNAWNWHTFTSPGGEGGLDSGYRVVDTDVSGSTFGYWNGTVSVPRNIQLGIRLLF